MNGKNYGEIREVKNSALVIDDDAFTVDMFKAWLETVGFEVATAFSGNEGVTRTEETDFDVILTDLNMPDINGIEMVRRSKVLRPNTEIIVVTGDDSRERAVEATREGAFDYIVKPVDLDKLYPVIRNAVERKRQAEEIKRLQNQLRDSKSYYGIIGGSRSMQNIYEIIENVAQSDANILILGESGTGKEVIANAIHFKSQRANEPFIKVNCSALPKDLIESQLFGHVKGSFTGANSDKVGFIGQAKGGSLLLDEIGEMPIDLQPKLLRILQERVYYRVGSDKPLDADFRLICSTNRVPFEAISDGDLREDLYYRINTIEIKIPPLRERMEDVPMLAEHFLKGYSEQYGREGLEFSGSAYDQMLNYAWRGNVRELQHAIERAVLLSKAEKIEELEIPNSPRAAFAGADGFAQASAAGDSADPAAAPAGISLAMLSRELSMPATLSAEELFEEVGKLIVERLPEPPDGEQQKDVFDGIEGGVVLAALKRTGGNKQAAANLLGLYRPRLYGMIKRHNLDEKLA